MIIVIVIVINITIIVVAIIIAVTSIITVIVTIILLLLRPLPPALRAALVSAGEDPSGVSATAVAAPSRSAAAFSLKPAALSRLFSQAFVGMGWD